MKEYKVKSTMSVDVEYTVEANSEDEAKSIFYATDFARIVEDGLVQRADSEETTAELTYAEYVVKTSKIKYNITDFDIPMFDDLTPEELEEEKEKLKNSLPQELTLVFDARPDQIEEEVKNAIFDKFDIEVDWVEYKIIEIR